MSNHIDFETNMLVNAKSWTKGVLFEEEAKVQVRKMASLPFVGPHIAIMPDVHAGMGSTVGSVIPTEGAIIPACVGVDIGCVDFDTEFLTPQGWKKIGNYNAGDLVMQYNPTTGHGQFVQPSAFIKLPCNEFYHLHTKYGINQMVSAEHKVLYAKYDREYKFDKLDTISAEELVKKHNETVLGFRGRFLTTFIPDIANGMAPQNADLLRVMVMVMADGHFPNPNTNNCVLQIKKERKIVRAAELLNKANILHIIYRNEKTGVVTFRFDAPCHEKDMNWLWGAQLPDLKIICDEVFHWDGNIKERCFYTRIKASADFMSYAFTACGYRAVVREDLHKDGRIDYRVFAHTNTKIGINGTPKSKIGIVPSVDGFKYCFTLPSGYWVMRRGGVVAITGNCGMIALRTSLNARDLPDSLSNLRSKIEQAIPVGRSDNGGRNDRGAWGNPPATVRSAWGTMHQDFLDLAKKYPKLTSRSDDRPIRQLGTLGTGNHFIEICLDESDALWVMLHSGSRGIGNSIGSHFISIAKEEMLQKGIRVIDKDLSYLVEGSETFDDYVMAVGWAQNYARVNRDIMMGLTLQAMRDAGLRPFVANVEAINCHHNYVSRETHFGKDLLVTRKGAVRAAKGVMGIIPGSMGAKSYIVRGKGNPESFDSCSHGAGRTMSRTEAKRRFTLEDHIQATQGIECRKDNDVIDETPACYKDIDAVMEAQNDLVEIVHTLRQVVCVKG
jgi:tRNA-splicing ligase RtcB